MNDLVRLILSLSLSGSILALLILILKPMMKHKISKAIQYYIWILVLMRLVVPFSFEKSIMNEVFYQEQVPIGAITQSEINTTNNLPTTVTQEEVERELTYIDNTNNSKYFAKITDNIELYIWGLGVILALTINLLGYFRFLKYLKITNIHATEKDIHTLEKILPKRRNVKLARNKLITTPMLIGVFKPCIVIPDVFFTEKQLSNIFLHEITHLNRGDIAVKWLTMIVTSVHWFNPLVYVIKREINHACELSCDEAVIKEFNSRDKQEYGETLISVVSDKKLHVGVMQATMSEEKRTIKERLVSIMKHGKKSKLAVVMSVVLVIGVASLGVLLGACGRSSQKELVEQTEQTQQTEKPEEAEKPDAGEQIEQTGSVFYVKSQSGNLYLGDWSYKVDLEDVFGNKISERTEVLSNADTFTGMHEKNIEFEGAKVRLYSADNGKTFWVQNVLVTDSKYEVLSGIRVGHSLASLKKEIQDIVLVNEDKNNQIYMFSRGYYMVLFNVSNDEIKSIEVRREMP